MPCELIDDLLKENARKAFERVRESRRNMKSLQTQVAKGAKNIDIAFMRAAFIRARIADHKKVSGKYKVQKVKL